MESVKEHNRQYDLEFLDSFILEELNPDSSGFSTTPEKLEQWKSTSRTQVTAIQKNIICITFALNNERKAKTFIQNHQNRISFLVNTITGYLEVVPETSNPGYYETIVFVRERLIDILKFLSSQYKVYFDFGAEATITFKQRACGLFKEKVDEIRGNCLSQDCQLVELALKPVLGFMQQCETAPCSFQTIMYYNALLKEICKLEPGDKSFERKLKFSMICLNYNSYRFFGYLADEIKLELKKIVGHSGKVELLSRYLKEYNQIQEYPDLVLKPKQRPIKEQITIWIIEEIECLERSLKTKTQGTAQNQIVPDSFKIETGMSVAQLGCLARAMMESRAITNQNQRDVIRFFASNVKTKQVDGISAESLRTRFYNIEDSTRAAVKETIIRMLNFLNQKG
ncbi:MAG: hypothetical protein JXB34_09045 [Bacteroidales bacterium]|nr:hypothetical protein [Bacteroidales bacterium]